MNKKIIGVFTLLALTSPFVFADSLCIALTNYSPNTVQFSGLSDPGYEYTVPPLQSSTLSGDHMVGSCTKDKCTVTITDTFTNALTIAYNIPPGAHIIYGAQNQYYVDPDAGIKCLNSKK